LPPLNLKQIEIQENQSFLLRKNSETILFQHGPALGI